MRQPNGLRYTGTDPPKEASGLSGSFAFLRGLGPRLKMRVEGPLVGSHGAHCSSTVPEQQAGALLTFAERLMTWPEAAVKIAQALAVGAIGVACFWFLAKLGD